MYLLSSNPTLTNSIIWDNSPESIDGNGEPMITYSDIEGGWTGEGNIDLDPLFTDSVNDDFNLQAGSPCIDTGISDIDGDGVEDIVNYYGSAPDMGAFESLYFNIEADVNGDGIVNIQDVLLILEFIFEYVEPENWQIAAADVNLDGEINIFDITYIVSHRILSE